MHDGMTIVGVCTAIVVATTAMWMTYHGYGGIGVRGRLGVPRRAQRPFPATVMASLVAVLGVGALGGHLPGAFVLAGALAAVARIGLRLARAARAERRYEEALPDLLRAMARSARTGAGLSRSVMEARRSVDEVLRADLERLVRRLAVTGSVVEAFAEWSDVRRRPSSRLVAGVIELVHATGAPQARALDAAALSLHEWQEVRSIARGSAAQAHATAVVLVILPWVAAGVMSVTDANARRFLWASTPGAAVVLSAILLQGLGAWVLQRMQRWVVPR